MQDTEFMQWAYKLAMAKMPKSGTGYHTIGHVDTMLGDLKQIANRLSEEEYEDLYVAVCMHDIVHGNLPGRDETASAEYFRSNIPTTLAHGIGADRVERIERLILATDYTRTLPELPKDETRLLHIIRDLDRLCFSTLERFASADRQLCEEAAKAGMPEEKFRKCRCEFLRKLLACITTEGQLYHSEYFGNLNSDAYINLITKIAYYDR